MASKVLKVDSKTKWDDLFGLYRRFAAVMRVWMMMILKPCLTSCSTTIVVHFSAEWSDACKQIIEVLNELSQEVDPSKVTVCAVEAEKAPEISLQYNIIAVPTVLFLVVSTSAITASSDARRVYRTAKSLIASTAYTCRRL